ncbi:MAG TPA: hypothetical protein VI997_07045 [Candidatus Thermoplasmatota archaeon]|nr:hypothetical protein [Candidatus Thermoplasmatota archaeon]
MVALRFVFPVAFVLLAAGCIGPASEQLTAAGDGLPSTTAVVPELPDFDWTTVVDPDHASHQAPLLHEGGHGLTLTGYTAIQPSLPPGVRGSITQVDAWGTYAVVSGMEGGLAFAIVDIADATSPKVVSYWLANADGWTARFSDDGNYIFYGCQVLGGPFGLAMVATGTRPLGDCEDPMDPGPTRQGGVVAIDVTDKAAPEFVAFVPGVAAHNIHTAYIAGKDYIFTNHVDIIEFDREAGTLEVVSEVPGVHDATVQKHPITGDWLLYTGTDDFAIYNVNDPANPEPVFEGGVEGADGEMLVGWHEQTPIPGLIEGRYIMALAGETFSPVFGRSTDMSVRDAVAFVDITDPANPIPLGVWHAPWKPGAPWASYLYSVHEMAATPTGQLAVAWYHGGIWVLDVSTAERMLEPATIAAYLPNMPITALPATFVQTPVPVVPFVWGAGWDDRGYLLVPDMHTGLYLLEPEWGLHPAVAGGQ